MKILKGDNVAMVVGKDRGKTGKVIEVRPRDNKVVVEGLNLLKKFAKPRKEGQKGQIVEFPSAVPVERVMLVCPSCQKPARVGYRVVEGKKERRCVKCDAAIVVKKK